MENGRFCLRRWAPLQLLEFGSAPCSLVGRVRMKVGDIVKLIAEPNVDWMFNYLEETFQVLDFPTETGVELKMIGSVPDWIWIIGKDNLVLMEEQADGN